MYLSLARIALTLTLVQGAMPCLASADASVPVSLYKYLDRKVVSADEPEIVIAVEVLAANGLNVADRTPVSLQIRGADLTIDLEADTSHGVAQFRVALGSKVASYEVVAIAGKVASAPQTFETIPSSPYQFSHRLGHCAHDGNCLIETSSIKDRHGNEVQTGTRGELRTYVSGQLVQQQSVQVIDGAVRAFWPRPSQPARVELILGTVSAHLWVAGR